MGRRDRIRTSIVTLTLLATPLTGGFILAQPAGGAIPRGQTPARPAGSPTGNATGNAAEGPSPTSLPADPSVNRRLDEASGLIERGEWDRACYLLQTLLDEQTPSFIRQADGTWQNSRDAAEQKLSTSPAPLLARYLELYSEQARRLFQKEAGLRDVERWGQVAQRFFLTEAGRQAANRLGSWHLDRGHAELASMWFRRVLDSPAHQGADLDSLRIKEAASRVMRGDKVDLASLPQRTLIGGTWLATDDWLDQWTREWAVKKVNASSPEPPVDLDSLPLLDPVWGMPLSEDQTLSGLLREAVESSSSRKVPLLFGYRPTTVGNRILVRTLDGASLLDLQEGVRHATVSVRSSVLAELGRPDFQAVQLSAAPGGVECAFFSNQVYGRVSSDGSRFYLTDDLPLSPQYHQMPFVNRRGNDPALDRSRNTLVAVEASTGKILWRREGALAPAGETQPPVYFFGPPVPWREELLVMGESRAEISLYSLDPKTGEILWREILAVAARGVDADIFRRSQVCDLVLHQGILLCPTNLYRLVAIDPATRRRLWDYSLTREGNIPVQYTMGMQGVISPAPSMVDPPLVDGRVVIATEAVGQRLHGVDLQTGEPRWQTPKDGDLFCAGVRDGLLITVSPQRLRGLQSQTGEVVWQTPIPSPSGRGWWFGRHYALPTGDGRLILVDTQNGKIVHEMTTRDRLPLGNLDRQGDRFVAAGGTGIQVFRSLGEVRREVNDLLARRAEDPVGLYRRAQLSLAEGKVAVAVRDLQAVLKGNPDPTIATQSRDLLFDIARTGGDNLDPVGTNLVRELGILAETDEQKGIYLRLRAQQHALQGDWSGALSAVDDHAQLQLAEPILSPQPALERSADAWAYSFLARWLHPSAPQAEKLASLLRARLRSKQSAGDLNSLLDLSRISPDRAITSEAHEATAQILSTQKEWGLAELAWLGLLDRGSPAGQVQALRSLSELAWSNRRPEDAWYFFRRLESDHARTPLPPGVVDSATYSREWKKDHPQPAAGEDPSSDWSTDSIRSETERAYRPDPNKRLAFPVDNSLPFFRDWSIYFDQQRWEMEFIRRSTGQLDWKLLQLPPALAYQQPVAFHQVGTHLIFEQSDSVYCVSSIDRQLRWHRSFDDSSAELTRQVGTSGQVRIMRASSVLGSSGQMVWPRVVAAGPETVILRAGRQLVVLRTATGEIVWRRNDLRQDQLASADLDYTLLLSPTGEIDIHRTQDGERIKSTSIQTDLRSLRGTVDRRLLLFQAARDRDGSRLLRLYDPVQEKDSWTRTLPATTDWKMADDRRMVLFGDKKVVVVDAPTGTILLEDAIDPGPAENSGSLQISAFTDRRRLYLTAMRAVPGQSSWPVSPSNNLKLAMVHGWIRAYDLAEKKLLWSREMFNRSIITAPGEDLPVLVAVGNRMVDLGENRKRLATDVDLIDKRTGQLVASEQHDQYGTMLELVSSREPAMLELRGYNLKVRFLFDRPGETPSRKAPPMPTDAHPSQEPKAASPFLQRFLDRARQEREKKGAVAPAVKEAP